MCGVSVLYNVDESIWPGDPNQSRRRFILRNYNNRRRDDWFRLLYKKPQRTTDKSHLRSGLRDNKFSSVHLSYTWWTCGHFSVSQIPLQCGQSCPMVKCLKFYVKWKMVFWFQWVKSVSSLVCKSPFLQFSKNQTWSMISYTVRKILPQVLF